MGQTDILMFMLVIICIASFLIYICDISINVINPNSTFCGPFATMPPDPSGVYPNNWFMGLFVGSIIADFLIFIFVCGIWHCMHEIHVNGELSYKYTNNVLLILVFLLSLGVTIENIIGLSSDPLIINSDCLTNSVIPTLVLNSVILIFSAIYLLYSLDNFVKSSFFSK